MKKFYLILAAACVALVGCNKSEVVDSSAPAKVNFKVMASATTKVANPEYTGTDFLVSDGMGGYNQAPSDIRIYGAMKDKIGSVVTGDVFGTYSSLTYNAGAWEPDDPIYIPLGDMQYDFLSLAFAGNDPLNGFSHYSVTNVAADMSSRVEVDVNSDDHNSGYQHDMMWATANGIKGADGSATPDRNVAVLHYRHAFAAIIFNFSFGDVHPLIAGGTVPFKINSIGLGHVAAGAFVSDLYQSGDFIVDNHLHTPVAYWDNLALGTGLIDEDADNASALNTLCSRVLGFGNGMAASMTGTVDDLYQAGHTLLVPEQEKTNFVIEYQFGANSPQLLEVNSPRGTWEMGKVYIYNVHITNVGLVEFELDVQEYVQGVDSPFEVVY